MGALLRVSVTPQGWSACTRSSRPSSTPRRRPVFAWGVFTEHDASVKIVGLVARGQELVRSDRLADFEGYAAGPGTEPQLELPALPPADLTEAMHDALAVDAADWEGYEARIREQLTSAANRDWATVALKGFEQSPREWFRYWLQTRREHEATEADLMRRLRALSHIEPGLSLEAALAATGITLGELLAMELSDTNTQGRSSHA